MTTTKMVYNLIIASLIFLAAPLLVFNFENDSNDKDDYLDQIFSKCNQTMLREKVDYCNLCLITLAKCMDKNFDEENEKNCDMHLSNHVKRYELKYNSCFECFEFDDTLPSVCRQFIHGVFDCDELSKYKYNR